ncbi:hypothetical protein C8Q73DRAFT_604308, partial [Cubamyces lactineus]
HTCQWDKDGEEVSEPGSDPVGSSGVPQRRVVYWWHDQSTFYAHNQCMQHWVHKMGKAVPQTKGEGASLMVADFISAEYDWLCSLDGKQSSACVLFLAGMNWDGYFTHEEILQHTTTAMDILKQHYPDEDHAFVFNNAPTHL